MKSVVFFLVATTLFSLAGFSEPVSYKESREGGYFYLNPFAHKPETSQEHLEYASALKESGKLSAARKQFEILLKRWPESPQAAGAKQKIADIYFEQGEYRDAFETYSELIREYYTGLTDYNRILERQYQIALEEMDRKRMRFLFGGYRAPEQAIPYLETILRNAPQWERAPEMQYQIGEAYRKNGEEEMAVAAYSAVEYRYPDSPFAEKAAYAKVKCLEELVRVTPYSVDIREEAQLAVELFSAIYTNSDHLVEMDQLADRFLNAAAAQDYETGEFYERVPKPAETEAAKIYYEKVIREHSDTRYARMAGHRLRVVFGGEAPAGAITAVEAETGEVETFPLPEQWMEDPEAVEVTADRMEYEGDLLVGEGHVAIQQEEASLRADKVTMNPETGEVTAMGNVVLLRGADRWEGHKLLYNFRTKEGNFGPSSMYFDPVYITAQSIERISTNEVVLFDARMTTCSGDNPGIYAKAKEIRIIDEKKASKTLIQAKHVTFYAGGVPVFYTPYWHRHTGEHKFTFVAGYSGDLGGFLLSKVKFYPTDWLSLHTHLDVYTKRGIGLGQDAFWKTENGGGGLKLYYINDGDPHDNDELPSEAGLVDSERYRVHLDHREQISDDTYFQTEWNYLSDPDVLEDFFNSEFRERANPENYAVVQHATDKYAASLRADHRLNDFYTTVDRMPELEFNWYRSQVKESPLFFQSDNTVGFYEMLNAETNLPPLPRNNNYSSVRMDSYNQLFLPLRYQEFLNVIPRVAYRGTWYSDSVNSSAIYRSIFEAGVLTSFKAHKELTEKSGFYGTGLRHVVEPYAEYLLRPEPDQRPIDLFQFDEIDSLDERNEVRFGVRNFIQTKRGLKRIVNFLDADIFTTYRFDPEAGEEDFGPLEADAEMSLTDRFSIQSDFEYDWYSSGFDVFNARLKYRTASDSEYALGYRYRETRRSLVTASAFLFPHESWSYDIHVRYDAERQEWEERRIMVNHKFDCLGLGLGLKIDEDDEPGLWFQLWLTAYDRPEGQERIR